MGFFDSSQSKPKKNKYQILYDSITEVLNLLDRKKRLLRDGMLVDLEFDKLMTERLKLIVIIKNGSISFLGQDFTKELLNVFDDQEINEKRISNILRYLENEQSKLKKLF